MRRDRGKELIQKRQNMPSLKKLKAKEDMKERRKKYGWNYIVHTCSETFASLSLFLPVQTRPLFLNAKVFPEV